MYSSFACFYIFVLFCFGFCACLLLFCFAFCICFFVVVVVHICSKKNQIPFLIFSLLSFFFF